ncbi:MAG: SGNH/GDSL hydrolase family protein [Clostridia bacterium]|nr:SGNH/GDSL hydrolase family protein [Clostridia bacterium]
MKKWIALFLCAFFAFGCSCGCGEELSADRLMSYYDDGIFVGDSIIRMLKNYVGFRQQEDATFFANTGFYASYSYTLEAAATDGPAPNEVNLLFRGKETPLSRLVEKLQPGKLFLLAGLNDRIGEYPEAGMAYVEAIVALVRQYAPDTQIHFLSLLPVTAHAESERPQLQKMWDAYNELLRLKCEELGVVYIDVATPLKNDSGYLSIPLSHDYKYHLNDDGNAILVRTLLDFARSRYEAGLWQPETK